MASTWLGELIERRRQRAAANRAARVRFVVEPLPPRETAPQASPLDQRINGLLIAWHEWRAGYSLGCGYSGSDATCRDFRAPTHWDWRNGAMEARAEDQIMRGVDRAIDRVPNTPRRWQTVIQFEARDLHSGARVWSSPMLPRDQAELEVLRIEARNRLLRELQREGVLT